MLLVTLVMVFLLFQRGVIEGPGLVLALKLQLAADQPPGLAILLDVDALGIGQLDGHRLRFARVAHVVYLYEAVSFDLGLSADEEVLRHLCF